MPFLFIAPDVGVKPNEARMADGAALKTRLAASKVILLGPLTGAIGPTTTVTQLLANEATFSGYTPGGNAIAAFGDPFVDPDGDGVLIVAPTVQFNFLDPDPDPAVEEVIKGFAVLTAAGVLVHAVLFDNPVPMSDNSDSIPIVVAFRV